MSRQMANLLFQSECHPLVPLEYETAQQYCLGLIHRKAYARARKMAVGLDVLDLGCNNGYGSAVIAETATGVVGVDVSTDAVRTAKAQFAAPNLRFQTVDGGALPFDDARFDLVTSFQVIEHVVEVAPYLAEITRVLRSGAAAVFTTPNRTIRLDPGMKPWNRFHVTEYSAGGLSALIAPFFDEVMIEGLFAEPELYAIEARRVGRAREKARPHANPWVERARRLDSWAGRRWRGLRHVFGLPTKRRLPSSDRSFLERWSLDDLYYRVEGLDAALDLIAVCRRSG